MTTTEKPDHPDRTTLDRLVEHRPPAAPVDLTKPVTPRWVRDAATRRAAVKTWRTRAAYRARRFAVQGPVLAAHLLMYAPRGLARIVARLARYLYDHDSAQVRHAHAEKTETADYVRAQAVRKANLKARWMVAGTGGLLVGGPALAWTFPHVLAALAGVALGVWIVKLIPGRSLTEVAVGTVVGLGVAWFLPAALVLLPRPPAWALWSLLAVVIVALGWVGRPKGKPLVKDGTLPAGVTPPLRAPVIVAALCALGNAKMSAKTEESPATAIRLLGDIHRNGPGVQADLELPAGVPAAFVMGKREEFAAALRRELGCVWPSVGKRHPGHLTLFVSDQPMNAADQEPWPLLKDGMVDVFQPFPAFTDQRGQWVNLTLAYASMIIGAVPRMGKTFVLRQMLLSCALDPRVKIVALDGKGTGDLAPLQPVAHAYVRGARSDQPEKIEKVRAIVRELRAELGRRADFIDGLSREECPESKVTSALATKYPQLRPYVVGIDETQAYFAFGDDGNKEHKAIRQELRAGITELSKLGPALGIWVILATQQVNQETLPNSIAQNAVIRYCLKVEGHEPNDRVLGTGAYKRGIDAQMFDIDDKGIGYLKADGDVARIVRSAFGLDAVAAEKVGVRARAYREARGMLTGDAAGEETTQEAVQVSLLDDCRDVMDNPPARALHLAELRDALELLRPATWGHLDNAALGAMLREARVQVRTVWSSRLKKDGKGIKREWLDAATTAGQDPDEGDGGEVISLTGAR